MSRGRHTPQVGRAAGPLTAAFQDRREGRAAADAYVYATALLPFTVTEAQVGARGARRVRLRCLHWNGAAPRRGYPGLTLSGLSRLCLCCRPRVQRRSRTDTVGHLLQVRAAVRVSNAIATVLLDKRCELLGSMPEQVLCHSLFRIASCSRQGSSGTLLCASLTRTVIVFCALASHTAAPRSGEARARAGHPHVETLRGGAAGECRSLPSVVQRPRRAEKRAGVGRAKLLGGDKGGGGGRVCGRDPIERPSSAAPVAQTAMKAPNAFDRKAVA